VAAGATFAFFGQLEITKLGQRQVASKIDVDVLVMRAVGAALKLTRFLT